MFNRRKKIMGSIIFLIASLAALTLTFALAINARTPQRFSNSYAVASTTDPAIYSSPPNQTNLITVSGDGKTFASPDEAVITFGVSTIRNTASRAMNDNSTAMNKILSALRSNGLTDEEVKTGNISLYPQQDWREGRAPKIVSYTAENRIIVKTKKLNKLGQFIDSATKAGATEISQLMFQLSEDSNAKNEALKKAVKNARKKAETLAQETGSSLGRAIIINESSSGGTVVPLNTIQYRSLEKSFDGSVTPPVMPQDVEIIANVTISYELK